MNKSSQKNIVIVLQNIVTFRADWRSIARNSLNSDIFLITGTEGNNNLSDENRTVFSRHIVCEQFDFDTVKSACKTILDSNNCSDMSRVRIVTNDEYFLALAAQIREALGIPGISLSNILPFTDKIKMKQVVSQSGVRIPKAVKFNPSELANGADYLATIEKQLGYPIFAKQTDSAGSENVAKISDHAQLDFWCKRNKLNTNYELDEFITGELYHIDSLIKGGELIEQLICKYSCPNAEFLEGKALGSLQIDDSDCEFERLSWANKKILSSFESVPDGAFHLEVFLTDDNEIVFVEVAARAPGGWIPQMHKISRNYNIEEQHFLLQMGEFTGLTVTPGTYAAWIWFPQKEGMKVRKTKPAISDSKVNITWDLDNGEFQKKPVSVRDKVCGILLENNSYLRLKSDYRTLIKEFSPYE